MRRRFHHLSLHQQDAVRYNDLVRKRTEISVLRMAPIIGDTLLRFNYYAHDYNLHQHPAGQSSPDYNIN